MLMGYQGTQMYFGGQAFVLILNSIFPTFLRMKNTLPDRYEDILQLTPINSANLLQCWNHNAWIDWIRPFHHPLLSHNLFHSSAQDPEAVGSASGNCYRHFARHYGLGRSCMFNTHERLEERH